MSLRWLVREPEVMKTFGLAVLARIVEANGLMLLKEVVGQFVLRASSGFYE